MSVNPQQLTVQQKIIEQQNKHSLHPAIVYLIAGTVCLFFWAIGTSTQVMTSEAWMMHQTVNAIDVSAYSQIWEIIRTQHVSVPLVPFLFAWGVQLALIAGSIGVELPRKPVWRHRLSVWSCTVLIVANSCGDWEGSADYGFWGQAGFTAVVFFTTFVMLIIAIHFIKRSWEIAKLAKIQREIEEAKKS